MSEKIGDYKKTETYKNADNKTRLKIEAYRKENKVPEGAMYLQLLREDYRNLPKEEKQKGNRAAELIVLSGIISFLVLTARGMRSVMPYAAIYMFVVTAIYLSGILNPISRQLSNINKLLKKNYPDVPSIKDYLDKDNKEE